MEAPLCKPTQHLAFSLAISALVSNCIEEAQVDHSDVVPSTSLRGAGMVSIGLLLIPPLLNSLPFRLLPLIMICVAIGIVGNDIAPSAVRATEGIFVCMVGYALRGCMVWKFHGSEVSTGDNPEIEVKGFLPDTGTLAVLVYVGARLMHSGLFLVDLAVATIDANPGTIAVESTSASMSTAIGTTYVITAGSGLWLASNKHASHTSTPMAIGTALVCGLSAVSFFMLVDSISSYSLFFEVSTCDQHEDCADPFQQTRRIAVVSRNMGTLLFAAFSIGTAALSTFESRKNGSVLYSFAVCCTSLLFLCAYLPGVIHDGTFMAIDGVFLGVLLGIVVASILHELAGICIVYAALGTDLVLTIASSGDFSLFEYYTYVCNGVLFLGAIVVLPMRFVESRAGATQTPTLRLSLFIFAIQQTMRSISFSLALLTTSVVALYDGRSLSQLVEKIVGDVIMSPFRTYRIAATRFILWHYIPVLVWFILGKSTRARLSKKWSWGVWIGATASILLVYLCVVYTAGDGHLPVAYPLTDTLSVAVVFCTCVIPPFIFACHASVVALPSIPSIFP